MVFKIVICGVEDLPDTAQVGFTVRRTWDLILGNEALSRSRRRRHAGRGNCKHNPDCDIRQRASQCIVHYLFPVFFAASALAFITRSPRSEFSKAMFPS